MAPKNVFWHILRIDTFNAQLAQNTISRLIHVNNPLYSQDLFEVVLDPQSKASTSLSAAFACILQLSGVKLASWTFF